MLYEDCIFVTSIRIDLSYSIFEMFSEIPKSQIFEKKLLIWILEMFLYKL